MVIIEDSEFITRLKRPWVLAELKNMIVIL